MIRWLTLAAIAAMIGVNGLANALPINGKTTGDISDGFNILFTPAGYVFSIWGLIYLGLTAFGIVQALPSRRQTPVLQRIRPWVIANAAANAAWILAWHHEQFALSLVVMLAILGSLVMIYRELLAAPAAELAPSIVLRAPFSLYLGWISVAAIANTTVVLSVAGFADALADPTVTLAILAAATALCVTVSLRFADPVYAAVFVWALVGIALKHADRTPLFWGALSLAGVCALAGGMSTVGAARRSRAPS